MLAGRTGFNEQRFALKVDGAIVGGLAARDLDAKGRTGTHKLAVLEGPHKAEHEWSVRMVSRQASGGLDHRFEHHDAGQDRECREVVLEVFLCGGNVLEGDDVVWRLLQDPVNEVKVHNGG